jgi:hypothetical protein
MPGRTVTTASGRGRRRAVVARAVPAVAGLIVLVRAVAESARLPATVGLDGLARLQVSAYALVTRAVDRHATVAGAEQELALVTCGFLLVAVVALTRSLGVRPVASGLVLGVLALISPAVRALCTLGPGLLGAMWLTVGAALLTRRRTVLRALGAPAVAAGVVTAPVLAVPVLVGGAAVLVAMRVRRGALVLGVVFPLTVLPLVLLPPPGGAAAVPTLVVTAVLVGLVLVDGALDRLARRRRRPAAADPP